jgi:hypothetical protein
LSHKLKVLHNLKTIWYFKNIFSRFRNWNLDSKSCHFMDIDSVNELLKKSLLSLEMLYYHSVKFSLFLRGENFAKINTQINLCSLRDNYVVQAVDLVEFSHVKISGFTVVKYSNYCVILLFFLSCFYIRLY